MKSPNIWQTWASVACFLIVAFIEMLRDRGPAIRGTFWQSFALAVASAPPTIWLRKSFREWRRPTGQVSFHWPPSTLANPVTVTFVVVLIIINLVSCNKTDASNELHQVFVPGALSTNEAKSHVGQNATVCGIVVSIDYGGGGRTFIYFDKAWPHEVFTATIWVEDWRKFSPSPRSWKGKQVCATGVIRFYYGSPDILLKSPGQITLK